MQPTFLCYVAILAGGLLTAHAHAQEAVALDTDKAKLSYALGADIGKNLRDYSIDVTPELLFKGIDDALSGEHMLMSEQEVKAVVNAQRREIRQKQAIAAKNLAEENKRKEAEFLEANKKKEGVTTLASGLQYKILEQGDGPKPSITDRVVVHYRGTLIDGTEFDSSYARNQPATLMVKQVIRGWRDVLQLMPVGSKWQVFIPSHLAYGSRGAGPKIGPNATLIFELKLIGIEAKPAGDAQVAQSQDSTEVDTGTAQEEQPAVDLTDIKVSYKLDPRLMGGTYAQPGWVAPQVYQGINGQDTVEARADGLDKMGRIISDINVKWIPEDPDMVTVTPGQDDSVKIIILGPGESSLKVVHGEFSKTLSIKATSENDIMRIEISQL